MVRSHMMARTRSSQQTLNKRLMKHATPYKNLQEPRAKAQLTIGQSRPFAISEFRCPRRFQSCWHGGFRCLLGAK